MTIDSKPLVSVIVPAFNVDPFIGATLRSVLCQTYSHLEVLVVDDASTDATNRIVAALALEDTRIRLFRLPQNSGRPAVPRNCGLHKSRGELVAFLDGDDLWASRKLEEQISVMTAQPDLVMVYSMIRNIGAVELKYDLYPLPWRAGLSRSDLERGYTLPCATVLARRKLVEQLGGFDEDPGLKAIEDYDLWLRLTERGPLGFIPQVHALYRVHESGISRDVDAMNRRLGYLRRKRHLSQVPSVLPYPKSHFPWRVVRGIAHMMIFGGMQALGFFERRLLRRVPLYRCGRGGRQLLLVTRTKDAAVA